MNDTQRVDPAVSFIFARVFWEPKNCIGFAHRFRPASSKTGGVTFTTAAIELQPQFWYFQLTFKTTWCPIIVCFCLAFLLLKIASEKTMPGKSWCFFPRFLWCPSKYIRSFLFQLSLFIFIKLLFLPFNLFPAFRLRYPWRCGTCPMDWSKELAQERRANKSLIDSSSFNGWRSCFEQKKLFHKNKCHYTL